MQRYCKFLPIRQEEPYIMQVSVKDKVVVTPRRKKVRDETKEDVMKESARHRPQHIHQLSDLETRMFLSKLQEYGNASSGSNEWKATPPTRTLIRKAEDEVRLPNMIPSEREVNFDIFYMNWGSWNWVKWFLALQTKGFLVHQK